MMDTASVSYSFIAVIFIILYYLIILTDMKTRKVTAVYCLMFVIGLAVFVAANYFQRKKIESDLIQILAVASMGSNMEPQLSESSNYDKLLSTIEEREKLLYDIKSQNTIFDKLLGRDEETDSLISQTIHLLQFQKNRIVHLNSKSSYKFNALKCQDASSELKVLGSDVLNREYYNSGFRISHSAIFVENNVVLVRIVEQDKDSVLYQQSYVPKDSINSFVLPNLFSSDKIELQMGYINKSDTSTYHYISVRPYGK